VIKKIIRNFWPYLLLVTFGLLFFGYFLRGEKILLPADLLVGAYYPWRENKWGYEVAVPYKNPLLSDSYSQLYIWKSLIADSYKQGEWPLWNPYSYSGYPLAGNLQSAAFYPFNLLFIWFSMIPAWNIYLVLGPILASITMYMLIRILKMSKGAGIVGGLAYGYSAYAISWMEFATATNSMIWIPLLVVITEKYFLTQRLKVWKWLTPVVYCLISSGNFQMTIYGFVIFASYLTYKLINNRKPLNIKLFLTIIVWGIFGLLMSAILLLPSIEMWSLSIRDLENNLKNINYGLLPLANLITTTIPDFFGNPATANYWGVLNYHETLIYGGVVLFLSVMWSIFNFKTLPNFAKYFIFLIIISLFFYIDNPLIRLGYSINIPGLSTATAGRNAYFWCFGASVLLGYLVDHFNKNDWRNKTKLFIYWWLLFGVSGLVVWGVKQYYEQQVSKFLLNDIANMMVSLRNIVIPFSLSLVLAIIAIFFSKRKWWWLLLVFLIGFDSWRFTKKYLPVSNTKYVFPQTQITDFIIQDKEIFRVDKEKGALLSPNTWTMYGIQSPSGYDPMALAKYTSKFNFDINGTVNGFSRYAEIEKYDAKQLGEYNVKYLLALKKDGKDKTLKNLNNFGINTNDWESMYETDMVVVLKNKYFKKRVIILDNLNTEVGKANIVEYGNNELNIKYDTNQNSNLIILDTWYPGWKAWLNGKEVTIDKYNDVFRKIEISKGSGLVKMKYEPENFNNGKLISLVALMVWLLFLVV